MKRKLFSRCLSLVITIIMLLQYNIVVTAEENINFDDVKNYYPYSSWAVETGAKYSLIFLENNRRETKRWEIANILYDILKLKNSNIKTKDFSDTYELDNNIEDKIAAVAGSGIVQGYEDGSFRPFNNVTRAEFVTMIDRSGILNKKNIVTSSTVFNDIESHWAKESIKKVAMSGVVTGKGNNNFCPEDNITPQEILIILDRLVELKCIDSEILSSTMIDTFKCKKYGEKEKYIVEVMYAKFDQVQNDITYSWPYKKYYNPENWQELATYEDLQYAIYFTVSNELKWYNEGTEGREKIDRMVKNMLQVEGFDNDKDKYFPCTFTMKNLLSAILTIEIIGDSNTSSFYPDQLNYTTDECVEMANFSNMNNMSRSEQGLVASSAVTYHRSNAFLENNNMYFPLEAPVTKYMLNYVILGLQNRSNFIYGISGYYFGKFLGMDVAQIETNPANLPANYYEYPFIMKNVPKEVYEKQFQHYGINIYNAAECFEKYAPYAEHLINESYFFYDTILNVDYRTMNIEAFVDKVTDYAIYVPEEEARSYAQYVIDNKIILKGKGSIVPGTIIISEPIAFTRVILDFEIISADQMKNLLLGDHNPMLSDETIYRSNKYYSIIEVSFMGRFMKDNGKLIYDQYGIIYDHEMHKDIDNELLK